MGPFANGTILFKHVSPAKDSVLVRPIVHFLANIAALPCETPGSDDRVKLVFANALSAATMLMGNYYWSDTLSQVIKNIKDQLSRDEIITAQTRISFPFAEVVDDYGAKISKNKQIVNVTEITDSYKQNGGDLMLVRQVLAAQSKSKRTASEQDDTPENNTPEKKDNTPEKKKLKTTDTKREGGSSGSKHEIKKKPAASNSKLEKETKKKLEARKKNPLLKNKPAACKKNTAETSKKTAQERETLKATLEAEKNDKKSARDQIISEGNGRYKLGKAATI